MSNSQRHYPHENRRQTKRMKAEDLPWLKEISVTGRRGQLIDLSSTGVYFETGVRLLPGRKTFVLLTTKDDARERLEGVIIRSQLVRIDEAGEAVYRTGVRFSRVFELGDGDDPASSSAHISIDSSTRVVELVEAVA